MDVCYINKFRIICMFLAEYCLRSRINIGMARKTGSRKTHFFSIHLFSRTVKLLGGYVTEDPRVVMNAERVLDRFQRSVRKLSVYLYYLIQ